MSQEQRIPPTDARPVAPSSSTTSAPEVDTVSCAACPHDRDAHDAIGTRFCAATIAGAVPRGCACAGEARGPVHRAR
ncbi:RGCVC family protein [Pseudonocardia cypriaca]|uniref:RGCVC family protein n=1 Tax=Pseudonocardia cypriaca TaxID=882449 RepID=UPI00114F7430|nr:RGCVC family protein [Pseudonocardia cypriaca]